MTDKVARTQISGATELNAAPPSARLVAIDELCALTGVPRRTAWALVERLGLDTWKVAGDKRTHVDALALSVALIRQQRARPPKRR